MVEGHQVHRVAAAHRKLLVGSRFRCTSPNGRFADGAAAIDGALLTRVEAYGKNLLYVFSNGPAAAAAAAAAAPRSTAAGAAAPPPPRPSSAAEAAEQAMASVHPDHDVTMHVHFGMSGAFSTFSTAKGSTRAAPEPTPTTRLRIEALPGTPAQGIVGHLSAMTVQYGRGGALMAERVRQLGPDPLRDDADPQRFFAALASAPPKKPAGLMLMDQSVMAGAGNIYRAEICFKARVHPEQPAASLPRSAAERLWHHSADLLRRGFQTGSILTVDPEDAARLGKPWTRRYVYNQARCGECGGRVASWDMAGRTCYACPACQPLVAAGEDPIERSHAELARRAREGAGGGAAAGGSKSKAAAATTAAAAAAAAAAPLEESLLSPARRAALAKKRGAKTFKSHCAPDDDAADEAEAAAAAGAGAAALRALLNKLTVAELRARLEAEVEGKKQGSTTTKAALVEQLAAVMAGRAPAAAAAAVPTPSRSVGSTAAGTLRRRPPTESESSEDEVDRADAALARANAPPPEPASAAEAALEKLLAGEHRGVEHVALVDDAALDVIEAAAAAAAAKSKGKKKKSSKTGGQGKPAGGKAAAAPPKRARRAAA
jgi:formamidopyrimidine-DNA glycosylase